MADSETTDKYTEDGKVFQSLLEKAWREGYEEGTRATLRRTSLQAYKGDHGIDISTVKLLRFAISELPATLELLDAHGLPLRGEITENYSFGKSLFVYGKNYRPLTLGEPF